VSQGSDNQYGGGDPSFERIDADAVCEQCGTVNPEGTLFCKTCGNNLRDQRARRLATEGTGEYQDTPAQSRRRVFVGLLTVLALLLLVWAAMPGNVQRLQDRLTQGMSEDIYPEDADPSVYWDGSISDVFDAMVRDLRDNRITSEQIRQADETDFSRQTGYGGKYFLRRGSRPDDPVLGSALVVESENDLYFVALLEDTEIRGIGDTQTATYPSARFVGIRSNGRFSSGHGFAQPLEDGSFLCVGRRDNSEYSYEIMAYRLP
jgi:hypothetical protein